MLLRHTVLKAGNVTAPHYLFPCAHTHALQRRYGGEEHLDVTMTHNTQPVNHKFCTQTVLTDENTPATTTIRAQQCHAKVSYGLLANAAIPT
jgi:hypothetical protein